MAILTPLLLLMGCSGSPITNAILYEDEAFLAALPSKDMLAPPSTFLEDIPSGNSTVLSAAAEAANDLVDALDPILLSTEALRAEPPDVRSDVSREWEGVRVARVAESVESWVVDCEILRPEESGPIGWNLYRAEATEDETALWASGESTGDEGEFELAEGTLSATWSTDESGESRIVDVEVTDGTGLPVRAWALRGEQIFGWSGVFSVTEGGEVWPGWAAAAHTAEGGRSTGEIWRQDETIPFESCWDGAGNEVWMTGEADVIEAGGEDACALPNPAD